MTKPIHLEKTVVVCWGMALAALLLPTHADAQARETDRWASRFMVGLVNTGAAPTPVLDRDPATQLQADRGWSVFFDLSRDLTPALQVQVGFGLLDIPSNAIRNARAIDIGAFRAAEVHLGVVYTVHGRGLFDGYVGPMLAGIGKSIAMTRDDLSVAPIALSSTVGPGVQAGVRVKACSCDGAALDVNIRWSAMRAPISGGGRLDLDPWTVSIGIAFRH